MDFDCWLPRIPLNCAQRIPGNTTITKAPAFTGPKGVDMQIRNFAAVLALSLLSTVAVQAHSQNTSGNTLAENQAAAAQLDHPVQISSAAMDVMALTKVAPIYPQAAKDQGFEGSVIMMATIDEEGKVKSLDILSGPEVFREAALKAVNQWIYTPYMVNGQPVKMAAPIAINFTLK
jgi:protein TonB